MDVVTFFVAGSPHPQPRHAIVRATGHVYYPDKAGKLKRWVDCVKRAIPAEARFGDEPLAVYLTLHVARPDGHWLRSGQLSAAGRRSRLPPFDLDNYAKCVIDTMQGFGVFSNDSNIVDLAVRKRWCVQIDTPSGCMVTLAPVEMPV